MENVSRILNSSNSEHVQQSNSLWIMKVDIVVGSKGTLHITITRGWKYKWVQGRF